MESRKKKNNETNIGALVKKIREETLNGIETNHLKEE